MPGINHEVACHKLDIDPKIKPVCQRPRRTIVELCEKVNEEVTRLLSVMFTKLVEYPMLISNIVVVPKNNRKMRVCISFMNLNKVCPTHPYLLPRISDLVDATACFERLSFMDAFSGYNHIPLYEPDHVHTLFIKDNGLNYYTITPFVLKNTGRHIRNL